VTSAESLNARWKRKKLLTGPDRSDGWDGTGAPDWTVAVRIDHSYAYSCHHRALWPLVTSPHSHPSQAHTPPRNETIAPTPIFFFKFLLGKKTLTDHHQEHLCLCPCLCLCTCSLRPVLFFFGANRSVLRRRRCIAVARSHGDQIIGGSSPPFLSRAFSFFSFPYAQLAPLSLDFE